MAKLSINLMPPELEEQKKKRSRRSLLAALSIGCLVIVIAITAIVLTLRLSQSVILGQVKKDIDNAKAEVSSPELTHKEGVVLSLKSRLDNIKTLLDQETYSSYAFTLVNGLIPAGVQLSALNISNTGKVTLAVRTADINALEALFNNLINPDQNQKKINSVAIGGVNKLQNQDYNIDLSITLVGATK